VTLHAPLLGAGSCYLTDLLFVNASRVEGGLNDRVLESRRRLEAELAATLREVTETAEAALVRARQARDQGADSVRAALATVGERLRTVEENLPPRPEAA
jgi:hypothetical protein